MEDRAKSYHNALRLNEKGLSHEFAVARLTLGCLEFAISQTGFDIEEQKTREHGPDNPEIDIDSTRTIKLRFWKWLQNEVEAISIKDIENFILHAERLGWMLNMTVY